MTEPKDEGPLTFTVTLPPDSADQIEAMAAELQMKPQDLTPTLITTGVGRAPGHARATCQGSRPQRVRHRGRQLTGKPGSVSV